MFWQFLSPFQTTARAITARRLGALRRAAILGAAWLLALAPSTAADLAVATLKPWDTASTGAAGFSVAVHGDTALVGAPFAENGTGAVYVFRRSDGLWLPDQRLMASDASEATLFGWSVALGVSGDRKTAVVGAIFADDGAGAVYVFRKPTSLEGAGGWTEQQRLASGEEEPFFDFFGWSVAVDGDDTLLAGAPFVTLSLGGGAEGAGYVFERQGEIWSRQARLTASDAAEASLLGLSVALDGGTALLGAPGNLDEAGAGYLFVHSGSTWVERQKLTAEAGPEADLGFAVALEGATALLGAPAAENGQGVVFVFTRNGSTWSQRQRLSPPSVAVGGGFGLSVALDGDLTLVGALAAGLDDLFGEVELKLPPGAAQVFSRTGETWSPDVTLTGADPGAPDGFGFALSLDGGTAVVGAPTSVLMGTASGAAYAFDGLATPDGGGGVCTSSATSLCLADGRFRVTADWRTPQGDSGQGEAVKLTPDTGYFWFFSSSNVEMVVKVLDACSFADRFWVFAGGLTNVAVDLTVEDTRTGVVRPYSNPQRTPFQPIQDTDAFATCP